MTLMRHRSLAALTACGVATALIGSMPAVAAPVSSHAGSPSTSAAKKPKPPKDKDAKHLLDVQVLSFNDFHGNLDAPSGSSGRVVVDHKLDATGKAVDVTVDAGGAAYLATHLEKLREGQKTSFTFAAGDQIGASPLLSAAFHDEPTMEILNLMGVDAATVGNHEFDEGYQELLRIVKGGCIDDGDGKDNQNSCAAGPYAGADYPVTAANVFYEGTTKPILPAYTILKKGKVKLGVIGVVLKDTANIVTAAGVKGITFGDEVEAIDKAAAELKKRGVKSIVALVHQGGTPDKQQWQAPDGKTYAVNAAYDYTCQKGGTLAADSPILPIAQKASADVDVVLTAHTHQSYICDVPDPAKQSRLVTSALSFGRLVTDVRLKVDRRTKDVVRSTVTARQQIVSRDVTPNADVLALINRYKDLVKPIASKVLGKITSDVTKTQNAAGESALGDLIADAQLADPSVVTGGKAPVVAFMNPGGVRADLTYASSPAGEGDGVVTYEEAFTVQPFNNYLVSLDLTGAQIYALLNQQWSGANAASPKVLQVSKGFTYSWSAATKSVVPGSVALNGTPIDQGATYRVVTNNFLADGGDGFTTFKSAANVYYGGLDIDGFAAYLAANSPYSPQPLTRITVQ